MMADNERPIAAGSVSTTHPTPAKWISILLTTAGAGLWCFSLSLPVFVTPGEAVDWTGKDILGMGILAIPFIVVLPNSWGWFANPVMLGAVIFVLGG